MLGSSSALFLDSSAEGWARLACRRFPLQSLRLHSPKGQPLLILGGGGAALPALSLQQGTPCLGSSGKARRGGELPGRISGERGFWSNLGDSEETAAGGSTDSHRRKPIGSRRETGRREADALVIPRPAILNDQEGGREERWEATRQGKEPRRGRERSGRGVSAGTGGDPKWPSTGFPWHNLQLCALHFIPDCICLAASGNLWQNYCICCYRG